MKAKVPPLWRAHQCKSQVHQPSDDDDAADQASTWPSELRWLIKTASRFRPLDHPAPHLVGQLSHLGVIGPVGGWAGSSTSHPVARWRQGQVNTKTNEAPAARMRGKFTTTFYWPLCEPLKSELMRHFPHFSALFFGSAKVNISISDLATLLW